MEEIIMCKSCGHTMYYVENDRKNEFYTIKTDTWFCGYCKRTIEEPRYYKGVIWK